MFAETVFDARRIVYRKPSSDTFDLFSICVSFVSEFVVENSTNLAIIISIFAAGFKEEIEQLERIFGYCDDHPLSHDDNNNDENYDDAEYFDNNDDRDNYCNERNPVHHDVGAIFNNNNNDTYNNNDDDVGNEDDNDDDENDEERKSCYQNDHPVRNDNIDANDVYDELTIDGDAFNLGTNREDNESNGHPVCNCFKAFFSWLLCLED